MNVVPRRYLVFISRITTILKPAGLVLAIILAAASLQPAHAGGTIVVNTGVDDNSVNSNCSLREAIAAVASNTTVDACFNPGGADTITFAGNYVITLTSSLTINSASVTIIGNGQTHTIIQGAAVRGMFNDSLFLIFSSPNTTLENLTLRNGGGLYASDSWLTLSYVTIADNTSATLSGGGIHGVGAYIDMSHSTISGNLAAQYGGGIYVESGGDVTITDSTISGNTSVWGGGGIYLPTTSPLTITSSTFSGNATSGDGGGLSTSRPTTITDSRFLNNVAGGSGGAISSYAYSDHSMSVHGTCIVGNSAVAVIEGASVTQDYTGNWWGSASGPGPAGPSSGGDTVGTNIDFSGFLTAPIHGCPSGVNDLDAPTLTAPRDGAIVSKPPKLSWKGNRFALGYHVEVDDNPDFSSPEAVADPLKSPFVVTSLPFGVYTWHVATRDLFSQGAYSAPFSFEVTLNKLPKKNATLKNGLVKFAWQKVKGATYLLRITEETGHTVYFETPDPLNKPGFTVDKTAPLPSGDYSWQVSIDGGSTWTPAWMFHVP